MNASHLLCRHPSSASSYFFSYFQYFAPVLYGGVRSNLLTAEVPASWRWWALRLFQAVMTSMSDGIDVLGLLLSGDWFRRCISSSVTARRLASAKFAAK